MGGQMRGELGEDGLETILTALYLPLPYPKQACISLPVLSTGL